MQVEGTAIVTHSHFAISIKKSFVSLKENLHKFVNFQNAIRRNSILKICCCWVVQGIEKGVIEFAAENSEMKDINKLWMKRDAMKLKKKNEVGI
jgi:hypothetical protein